VIDLSLRWQVIHGDCLDVMRQLPDGGVDAVVTDPPYKLSQEYGSGADADNLLAVSGIWPVAPEMRRVTRAGGVCAMFYDTRILPLALAAMQRGDWKYLRALTMYRRWGAAHNLHGWMSTSDFVLVFASPNAKPTFHGKLQHDVYVKASPEPESFGHPAQKPAEFVQHLVENVTPASGLVFDPYCGSGTTGVAAIRAGYRFIGIEREASYVDIARRRIADAAAQGNLFQEAR